ncbi:LicD family protein [Lactobacillus sp.] [Lactiplantibacillus mudanjiangensis]|uniref:LicD family protein n=1 Tax=Lactiplantibacillus mudanjiangensis TaxID=1296538 RepID=UPI001014176E|nr:LicD family protein [Lactiplantibacillus mudanjiangensis]VDG17854.1 LicD family protein [Lactobacillus sp.] [Lactiplantibacillus mudanjiangensis]VDG32448.1 LicD family protein [Lactobacillus sp.] [Lactiplantibacillus mudanjiangensis]
MTLTPLHQVELNLMQVVINICDAEKIDYFLIGGSLLGAVRHQGFIPWDDDIDIGMRRSDYQRFIAVANHYLDPDAYFLQTGASDPDYALSYMKLLDVNTYIEEKNNVNNAFKGVFVDIFPFDKIPDDADLRRSQLMHFKLEDAAILLRLNYNFVKTPLRKLITKKTAQQLAEVNEHKQQREEYMRLYENSDSRTYKNLASQYDYDKEILTADELTQLKFAPFETIQVKIPVAYDAILTRMYGDYMQLPPTSQRVEKHLNKLIINNQEIL